MHVFPTAITNTELNQQSITSLLTSYSTSLNHPNHSHFDVRLNFLFILITTLLRYNSHSRKPMLSRWTYSMVFCIFRLMQLSSLPNYKTSSPSPPNLILSSHSYFPPPQAQTTLNLLSVSTDLPSLPHQYLLSIFFITTIPVSTKCNLTALVSISRMTNFMCFIDHLYIDSLYVVFREMSIQILSPFFN